MKTIYFVRHANAEKTAKKGKDMGRALTKEGKKAARYLANKLKNEKTTVDLILTSTAKRALQTATIFAKKLSYPKKNIAQRRELYDPLSPGNHLVMLKKIEGKHNSVMIIGHIPNSEQIVSYLLKNTDASIPAAGVVCIEVNQSWNNITKGSGKLKFIDFPVATAKKQDLKKAAKQLADNLSNQTENVLKKIDPVIVTGFRKYVKGSSEKLAKKFLREISSKRSVGVEAEKMLAKSKEEKADKGSQTQTTAKVKSKQQPPKPASKATAKIPPVASKESEPSSGTAAPEKTKPAKSGSEE